MKSTPTILGLYSIVLCTLLAWVFCSPLLGLSFTQKPTVSISITILLVVAIELSISIWGHSKLDWGQDISIFRKLMRAIKGMIGGTILFHLSAILYGAPISDKFIATLLWSVLMSSLTILPSSLLLGTRDWNAWRSLYFGDLSFHTVIERVCYCSTIGTIVGTWLGALPIPLDWDRPWQIWPVSCIYGALFGHIGGLVVAASRLVLKSDENLKSKSEDQFKLQKALS
eukprot:TRINITY_DN2464_c0_g2_i1.p1 TRINITY_DN2464_c0_g2~~TRINITY_DN2464_c0_g2_i1.p1  ORF type:complete len:227 (-),score=28.91 TRINITY_DN2464_c0_g2_i1:156-836(-)